jgi:acyl-CoA synthetase (AMP-forming)/AMP-acid ligase II
MKWLLNKFETFADRPAIIYKGLTYSYADLLNDIKLNISLFTNQFSAGETVALVGNYSFKTISAFFALYENNQIISPITNEEITELGSKLRMLRPDIVIELKAGLFTISKSESRQNNELISSLKHSGNAGLVLFTSGTTGEPKAILHNLDSIVDQYIRDYTKELNIIPLLGFDHIGGMDMMLSQFAISATLTIPDNRTPECICETIQKYKVNVISASPTFLNLLLISEAYKDYNLTSLKIIGYGSETMPGWLLKKLINLFPWISFQQKYGLSETNAIRIRSKAKDSLFFQIDDPLVEYKIVDNELWLKSPSIFTGYLDVSEDLKSEDGWLKTGDLVETDNEGFNKILGRKTDIINIGGEKVLPSEIESLLLEVPFIADCQVFGEKNMITGNIVVAEIVSTSDLPLTEQKQEIRKFLLNRLNRYKVPTKLCFVDNIAFNDRMKKIRKIT